MGTTLTVTAKGQVTLRKELLDHLGVLPGDKIIVEFLPSGRAEVRSAKARSTIENFIGCLKRRAGRALTVEEINAAAAEGWASKR